MTSHHLQRARAMCREHQRRTRALHEAWRHRGRLGSVPASLEGRLVGARKHVDEVHVFGKTFCAFSIAPILDTPHPLVTRCTSGAESQQQTPTRHMVDGLRLFHVHVRRP